MIHQLHQSTRSPAFWHVPMKTSIRSAMNTPAAISKKIAVSRTREILETAERIEVPSRAPVATLPKIAGGGNA